jgi:hypothetical protein
MIPEKTVLALEDVKKEILEFCLVPQGRPEILDHIQVENTPDFYIKYIKQLQDQRYITSDQLVNRSSTNKKFVITQKGLNYLKAIS